jgi:hypothetical protein
VPTLSWTVWNRHKVRALIANQETNSAAEIAMSLGQELAPNSKDSAKMKANSI